MANNREDNSWQLTGKRILGHSQERGLLATHGEGDSWPLTGKMIPGHSQGGGFLATHMEEDFLPIIGKDIPVTNSEEYSWPLTRKGHEAIH